MLDTKGEKWRIRPLSSHARPCLKLQRTATRRSKLRGHKSSDTALAIFEDHNREGREPRVSRTVSSNDCFRTHGKNKI